MYLEKNDLETARKYYARALEVDPNFAVANANMAWVDAQEGKDLDVALGMAQKAKSLMPEVAYNFRHVSLGNVQEGKLLRRDSLCLRSASRRLLILPSFDTTLDWLSWPPVRKSPAKHNSRLLSR